MSYEGYDQNICVNGHYYEADQYDYDSMCYCGAKSGWFNSVDQTNSHSPNDGIVPIEKLKVFLISAEEKETCNLGHSHITKQALYRVPTREETEKLREYDDFGAEKI